jgi:hypothetical protein
LTKSYLILIYDLHDITLTKSFCVLNFLIIFIKFIQKSFEVGRLSKYRTSYQNNFAFRCFERRPSSLIFKNKRKKIREEYQQICLKSLHFVKKFGIKCDPHQVPAVNGLVKIDTEGKNLFFKCTFGFNFVLN